MASPTVLNTSKLGNTAEKLPDAVQASRDTVTIYWYYLDGTAVALTGATITGVYQDVSSETVYAVDGVFAVTDGAAGEFTWAYGAGDVGSSGDYLVQIKGVLADTTVIYSSKVPWMVEETLGVGVVAAGVLVGVSPEEAAWLTAAEATGNALTDYALPSGAADNDYAKFTSATALEGRTYAELRSDINVEDGADVTDATNVAAAGAIMADAAILSKSGAYEVAAGDEAKIVECTGTFAINLPDGLDAGFQVVIVNISTGTITITADTTISTKDAAVTLPNQYGAATVYHSGSNVWIAFGDLE